MESSRQDGELGEKTIAQTLTPQTSESKDNAAKTKETTATIPLKLALIPVRSAAVSKQIQSHQKPLEAKQFPIVLGRTNLSQWWYESCDCQQYYCRLHCRPVAKNIGSLSKVMIQIDTRGNAHIVGKNPHLVTIISPSAVAASKNNNSNSNSEKKEDEATSKPKTNNTEDQQQDQKPVDLRPGDLLNIGRRDSEPWMRFQVVDAANHPPVAKNLQTKTSERNSRELKSEVPTNQTQQQQGQRTTATDQREAKAQSQQKHSNSHHDAQLPEWITTTTTTNSASGKRNRQSSSYHNSNIYRTTTDTKEQQHHQAMVATLTKAAAAAGAAADADERNKSKKHYRYNSYYNYYNHEAAAATADTFQQQQQRKRRRHTTSSFASFHQSSNSNKSVIRSAEDLFNKGSSRRGGKLHHINDPQIHLVFQDYETSAQFIRAGTIQGRNKTKRSKAINRNNNNYNINNTNTHDESTRSAKQRKKARTDRNFIGKPNDAVQHTTTTTTATTTTTISALTPASRVHNEEMAQKQHQSKSMGLLSKNYAAALLEDGTPSLEAPADADEKAMSTMPPPVIDQGLQPNRQS